VPIRRRNNQPLWSKEPRVAAAAPLADGRMQRLLRLRMRGMLPMGNGEGSEDDGNEGNKESKGVKGDKGEGDEGDDGNFPEGGGR
jgi:hypothetical protein